MRHETAKIPPPISGMSSPPLPFDPALDATRQTAQEFVTAATASARHRFFYDAEFSARVKQAQRALVEKAGRPVHYDAEMVAFILQVDDMTRADLEARKASGG